MTNKDKPTSIEFAPGCFDNFDGTQEELDEMVAEIKRMFESGNFEEKSNELSEEDFNELPNDVKEKLIGFFIDEEPRRNIQ